MPQPPAPLRVAKRPPSAVRDWLHYIWLAVKARSCSGLQGACEDNLTRFAALLTLRGIPGDPAAQRVYSALVSLLLARGLVVAWKGRIQHLAENLSLLPTTPEGLDKIAAAVEAAAEIEDIEKATFPVEAFVKVALQLPDAKEYVRVAKAGEKERGLEEWKIRTVFCQGTLGWVKARFRGVVGDLARPEYRDEALAKIRTVR